MPWNAARRRLATAPPHQGLRPAGLRRSGRTGWHGPQRNPPYGARWPVQTRTTEEIEQLAAPPDYAYGSIWHSLSGMGDFGRYILQSSLNDVESTDPQALLHDAERAIFDRVLDLGWTPERFKAIDSRRGWRDDNPVERVGKKYQWIGFYEVLGRITDNHDVSPSWESTQPQPYQYPEQLIWRDIDPTVLARSTASPPSGRPWFSPAEARFPEGIAADYPDDMTAIPDPLDLIAIRDPQGTPWLALASHPGWKQQIPPETKRSASRDARHGCTSPPTSCPSPDARPAELGTGQGLVRAVDARGPRHPQRAPRRLPR